MNKIIQKPWGFIEVLELNVEYMLQRLFMFEDKRCSLQYHKQKRETIFVMFGKLEIQVGQNKPEYFLLKPGESLTIEAGTIHRMKAIEPCQYLEMSTPHPDDVVRVSDDYGRA